MNLLKIAFKDLKSNPWFVILFSCNLALGLTGFSLVEAIKYSLEQSLYATSKNALGADFGLSARRKIKDTEESLVHELNAKAEKTHTIEMFSMVANANGQSRLLQIKSIEPKFPFYGNIKLQKLNSVTPEKVASLNNRGAWVYPEVITQLKVDVGSKIKLGHTEFIIQDVVTDDSAEGISTNMAPRIYINSENLEETGLLRPGSLAWHTTLYKIPTENLNELETLKDKVFEQIDDPDVQVYTHQNASEQSGRLLGYLSDFLGLCSLVALFLSAAGLCFLFQSYVREKIKTMAILISLGLSPKITVSIYLMQALILSLISGIGSIFLSWGILKVFGALILPLMPLKIELVMGPQTNLTVLIVGTLGSLLLILPLITPTLKIKPLQLLSPQIVLPMPKVSQQVLGFLPLLFFFTGLAVRLANSYRTGLLFMASFLISSLVLMLIGKVFFIVIEKNLKLIKNLTLRWSLRDLVRHPLPSLLSLLTLGLGIFLINLIPQLESSLQNELSGTNQQKIPSLFLFDIQDDQINDLKIYVENLGAPISHESPTIRARLTAINDQKFDKGVGNSQGLSREEEREMRFRNRGVNLSYRNLLSASEKIVEGKSFSGVYVDTENKLPEISIEKRFADRLKINVGDELTFDIESVEVKGVVTNFRSVKWASFQPNFFIQFQPGVLESAPKTHLATLPHLNFEMKQMIQDKLVEKFPNVSMVDVARVVEKISKIIDQMALALKVMSLFALLVGLLVIFIISNYQAKLKRYDIGLLKALGANDKVILNTFISQFIIIVLIASLSSGVLSLMGSYIFSRLLFDGAWSPNWLLPIYIALGSIVSVYIVSRLSVTASLRFKAKDLLG